MKLPINHRDLTCAIMGLALLALSQTRVEAEELRLKRTQALPQVAVPATQLQPITLPAETPAGELDVKVMPQTLPAIDATKKVTQEIGVKGVQPTARLPTPVKPATPAMQPVGSLPALKPINSVAPTVSGGVSRLPKINPVGQLEPSGKGNAEVLPLNTLEQFNHYASLPDSQKVQLPKHEGNKIVTLGEVRKKLAQDNGDRSTAGGSVEVRLENKRADKDTSGVDALYASARANIQAYAQSVRDKAIKINGSSNPSSWILAWNKPYVIESSDFKGITAIRLVLSKQNKTFDLPIKFGTSKAGSVEFSIPAHVIGVYEQPATLMLMDADGATYTTASSTFYPHIVSTTDGFALKVSLNRNAPVTSSGNSSLKLNGRRIDFVSRQTSDNPSNPAKQIFINVELGQKLSPHWTVTNFSAGAIAPTDNCEDFFANYPSVRQRLHPATAQVYIYTDLGGFDPSAYNRDHLTGGQFVVPGIVQHCKVKFWIDPNEHRFKSTIPFTFEISGPEGVPFY